MVEFVNSLDIPGLAILLLVVLVVFILILFLFRLYAIDRRLKVVLEELRRLNSEVRRKSEPGVTGRGRPSASVASVGWVDQFGDATEKTRRGLGEKSNKIS